MSASISSELTTEEALWQGELWLTQAEILIPALLAGTLILATHVPLGRIILQKGIIFADLAIAQIAVFAMVLLQNIVGESQSPSWTSLLWPALMAMAASSLLYLIRRQSAQRQEALIGVLFMLASTGVIIALSSDPHGGEKLKAALSGQILWLTLQDIALLALVSALLPLLWLALKRVNSDFAFYPVFAIAVTMAAQLVGVYLVFASLIIPALAATYAGMGLIWAFSVAWLAYLIGLSCSAVFDLPSGASICWSLALVGGLAALLTHKLILSQDLAKLK